MKILPLVLLFTSAAHAHWMSPVSWGGRDNLNSITINGVVRVPVTVGSSTLKDIEIYVDGNLFSKFKVGENQKVTQTIPVKLSKVGEVERHKICSLGYGSTINTKICATVKAFWLEM